MVLMGNEWAHCVVTVIDNPAHLDTQIAAIAAVMVTTLLDNMQLNGLSICSAVGTAPVCTATIANQALDQQMMLAASCSKQARNTSAEQTYIMAAYRLAAA